MEGTYLCKAVAVKIDDDNLFSEQRRGHICHCKNCRKVAGGVSGINLIIEEEKVEFPNGKDSIKRYSVSRRPGVSSIHTDRRAGFRDTQRNSSQSVLL